MAEMTVAASPTIRSLEDKREVENLSGAKFIKKKVLFGREYDFYEDGSILVVDPEKQHYHFLTKQGREKGRDLRTAAKNILNNPAELQTAHILGEGKGGLSKVYEIATENGPVAVKTTESTMFFIKEMMGEATTKATGKNSWDIIMGRSSRRHIVQKMSLKDTMKLFERLDSAGIKRPEFYGFSVKRNAGSNELQEIQFMQKIDRPTFESLMEAAAGAEVINGGILTPENFKYANLINDLAAKYFNGDQLALMRDIVPAFHYFVNGVKRKVWNIGDVEMDNIFFVGYDEEAKKPEFMLIDPIEEQIYLTNVEGREYKINNKNY